MDSFDPKARRKLRLIIERPEVDEINTAVDGAQRFYTPADALILGRIYDEGDHQVFLVGTFDGNRTQEVDADTLYRFWLSLTGYVGRQFPESSEGEANRRRRFLVTVLGFLGLDLDLKPTGSPEPQETPEGSN